jgi:hypothetical protein
VVKTGAKAEPGRIKAISEAASRIKAAKVAAKAAVRVAVKAAAKAKADRAAEAPAKKATGATSPTIPSGHERPDARAGKPRQALWS